MFFNVKINLQYISNEKYVIDYVIYCWSQCVDGLGNTSPVQLCDVTNMPTSTMSCLQSNVICGNTYCSQYGQFQVC